MSTFAYKALDGSGRTQTGTLEAESQGAAMRDLQSRGLLPTHLVEGGGREAAKAVQKAVKAAGGPTVRGRVGKKLKLSVLVNFTQQLATLVGAGSQLLDSLRLVQSQSADPTLRKTLEEIVTDIQQGDSLSEAMRKQKTMFPATMVSMIAAGEASGSLEKVLDRYGEYIQRQEELQARFKTMLIYPSFIIGASIILVSVLLVFVIPQFTEFLTDIGSDQKLPFTTNMLIKLSKIVSTTIGKIVVLGMPVSLVATVITFFKTKKGNEVWDRLRFKLPLFGAMAFQVMMARLAITLGTLIGSGVSIVPALLSVRDTMESQAIRAEMERIVGRIERGATLAETMDEGHVFPPLLVQVVRIGEEVGKLEPLLNRVGSYFDREARNASERITALIEPVMIVTMGLVVGFIVMSIILPIISAAQSGALKGA